MSEKIWVRDACDWLNKSLRPVPCELNELDWKSDLSSNKERVIEHLIAFGNYPGGGCMVFGVNDNGDMVGVDEKRCSDILSTLANLSRNGIEPPIALDHEVSDQFDAPLLFVRIPEQRVKPVHRRGKSIEETWIRSNGTTRKASRHELAGLMLNSQSPRWEMLRASNLLELEEIKNKLELKTIARLLEKPLPNDHDELAGWLRDEGIIEPEGRKYYITNFGAIAAAKDLNDYPGLARKQIRIIRYQGTNKVVTISEEIVHSGYAVSFEAVIAQLNRILPHSEVIEQALRTEVRVFPEIALRELIANALIHQDFSVTGAGPMIEIYDDRIEFTNPGGLLPSKREDRLIGTSPESRNETLASSFRLYRICEERGTGFQKIVTAIELFGLPPLQVTSMENAFRVSLKSPRSYGSMSQNERIEACYQHAVLQYLSSKTLTNTSLRSRFKLHDKQRNQITNLIGDAVANQRIKRKDQGAGTKFAEYIPYWAS